MLINATTPLAEARAELARSYDLAPSQAAARETEGRYARVSRVIPERDRYRGETSGIFFSRTSATLVLAIALASMGGACHAQNQKSYKNGADCLIQFHLFVSIRSR